MVRTRTRPLVQDLCLGSHQSRQTGSDGSTAAYPSEWPVIRSVNQDLELQAPARSLSCRIS